MRISAFVLSVCQLGFGEPQISYKNSSCIFRLMYAQYSSGCDTLAPK